MTFYSSYSLVCIAGDFITFPKNSVPTQQLTEPEGCRGQASLRGTFR